MNLQTHKTIIADDEQLARARLKSILAEFPEIEIIAEASDGLEALALIDQMKPDLLFLDIQMPGLTGFELLKKATHFPVVIFCTAYDDYALQAFETHSIDYIVKPVKVERVKMSIEKLVLLSQNSGKDQILRILDQYIQLPPKKMTSIPVKLGERTLFVKLTDVSYFSAEDKYVTIFTRDGKKYLTDYSLNLLEEKLDNDFIRIHRSLLVNISLINEINRHVSSRFVVKLDDAMKSRLISGRSYCNAIKSLFEL